MKTQIIILAVLLAGCFGSEPQKTGKEGKIMPEFTLLMLDSTIRLHSQDIPTGKPTVLYYFSPYCPHCKSQTKKIIEDIDILKNLQFYFISGFPLKDVKQFCKEYQLAKLPNVVVGLDSANFVSEYFEIPGFPYFAIYGSDKKLNNTYMGKTYSSQILKEAGE
jgi:thiol-disulfide isomerase/thioredoxin